MAALSDRLVLLVLGLLVSLVFFGPISVYRALGFAGWHRWMVRRVRGVARKLNRSHRSSGTRVYRGIMLLLFFGVLAGLLGYSLHRLTYAIPYAFVVEVFFIALLIPLRHLRDEVAEVARCVRRKQMDRARGLVEVLARRQHDGLDRHGMLRVSIEYLAENSCDKIIAPVLAYAMFGLAGLCVLRMVNLLDHLVGHRSKELIAFGWASAKLDDVLLWIPARLTGALFVLASFLVPKTRPHMALGIMLRQSHKTSSPNSGWPLAAMAGALHISLGGPRRVEGAVVDDAWIGKGSARIMLSDFYRAQWIYYIMTMLLLLILLMILALLSGTQLMPYAT